MKIRKIMTATLAVILIFGMAGCGGEKKKEETIDVTQTETKETETGTTEIKETEADKDTVKIPENATEILLTNPKIQAQASFYLPNEAAEWEITSLSSKDPIRPMQRYVYKTRTADDTPLTVDMLLSATTTDNLAEWFEKGEKTKAGDHDAIIETTDTSWEYKLDMGSFAEGLNMYIELRFSTGDEDFKDVKELADVRDMVLETIKATTDYEGKEDRSGRMYQGCGLCSLPATIEFEGETVEINQLPNYFSVYNLNTVIYDDDPIPTKIVATISNPIKDSYMEATDGYVECTIGGYSGIMKQTVSVGYVSSYIRLKVENVNYDMYATTYVDDTNLTDPAELASAISTMEEDPSQYYQMSLDLLDAMVNAAEFREADEAWFE